MGERIVRRQFAEGDSPRLADETPEEAFVFLGLPSQRQILGGSRDHEFLRARRAFAEELRDQWNSGPEGQTTVIERLLDVAVGRARERYGQHIRIARGGFPPRTIAQP